MQGQVMPSERILPLTLMEMPWQCLSNIQMASQGYMQINFYLIKMGGRDLLLLMQDQVMHMYHGLPLTRAVMPLPSSSRVMEAYIVSLLAQAAPSSPGGGDQLVL